MCMSGCNWVSNAAVPFCVHAGNACPSCSSGGCLALLLSAAAMWQSSTYHWVTLVRGFLCTLIHFADILHVWE